MKLIRFCFAIVFIATLTVSAAAQASRIHKEYLKDTKSTKVETPLLYVMNTPDLFIEFQLSAIYKGEQLTKPVKTIALTLFSLAKTTQYTAHEMLYATTDGTRWPIGGGSILDMKGETKNGTDTYYGPNPYIGMQVPFPASAKVRNKSGDVTGLHMEWLTVELKPEQLTKLAAAQKVSLQLRDKTFELNETHLSILRDYATQLTPSQP